MITPLKPTFLIISAYLRLLNAFGRLTTYRTERNGVQMVDDNIKDSSFQFLNKIQIFEKISVFFRFLFPRARISK